MHKKNTSKTKPGREYRYWRLNSPRPSSDNINRPFQESFPPMLAQPVSVAAVSFIEVYTRLAQSFEKYTCRRAPELLTMLSGDNYRVEPNNVASIWPLILLPSPPISYSETLVENYMDAETDPIGGVSEGIDGWGGVASIESTFLQSPFCNAEAHRDAPYVI